MCAACCMASTIHIGSLYLLYVWLAVWHRRLSVGGLYRLRGVLKVQVPHTKGFLAECSDQATIAFLLFLESGELLPSSLQDPSIQHEGLERRGYKEDDFLRDVVKVVRIGMCPAEKLLELYHNKWDREIENRCLKECCSDQRK